MLEIMMKLRPDYRAILRREGVFTSKEGNRFTVHLLYRDAQGGKQAKPSLLFGSEPLIISKESERLSGLITTQGTLHLVSQWDGEFRHLYTMEEGSVVLAVWKDDALYYVGMLDPESYEEDYTKQKNYFVTLRFSDFGRAKRLRHKFSGYRNLFEWLKLALKNTITNSFPQSDIYKPKPLLKPLDMVSLPYPVDYLHSRHSLCAEILHPKELGSVSTLDYYDEGDALLGAYCSAASFYKDKGGESLTLYQMMDGILTSLGLRMEQSGGRYIIYDRCSLLSRKPVALEVRSSDGVYVADESYTAVNISLESKDKSSSVKFEHPRIEDTSQEGDYYIEYPLYDNPDIPAYGVHLRRVHPMVDTVYHVSTTPKAIGERENFVALCFLPVQKKGAGIVQGYDHHHHDNADIAELIVQSVVYDGVSLGSSYGGIYSHRDSIGPKINLRTEDGRDYLYYYLSPMCFGYEHWLETQKLPLPTALFAVGREPLRRAISLKLDYFTQGKPLLLGAKLYMSFLPSLYEELGQFFRARDTGPYTRWGDDSTENDFPLSNMRSVGVYAEMSITDHLTQKRYVLVRSWERIKHVYKGRQTYQAQFGYRQVLSWITQEQERELQERGTTLFCIPFGMKDFKQDTWVEAAKEYLDLGGTKSNAHVDAYTNTPLVQPPYKGGMYIPPPPVTGEVKLNIYAKISLGNADLNAANHVGISLLTDPTSLDDKTRTKRAKFMISYGVERINKKNVDTKDVLRPAYIMENDGMFPSYVLLKDVKLSIIDLAKNEREGGEGGNIKRSAIINEKAYEALELEASLANDPALSHSSLSLLRDARGGRLETLFRSMEYSPEWEEDWWLRKIDHDKRSFKDSCEALASEAYAHYAKRKHTVEGTFRSVSALRPLEYVGKLYMATSVEEYVRSSKSEYTLSQVERSLYIPKLTQAEFREEDNEKYQVH